MNDLFIKKDFFTERLNHIVSVRTDDRLNNIISEFAKKHGLTSSEVVRLILQNYFYGDDDL